MEKLNTKTKGLKRKSEKLRQLINIYNDKKDSINDTNNQLTPEHQAFLDKNSLREETMIRYLKASKLRIIEVILLNYN